MARLWKMLKWMLITLVIMAGILLIFSPQVVKYMQHRYYREAYQPEEIDTATIKDFPEKYRIARIPWISYRKSYCQPAALQMIARKHGIREDLGYFNFLMSFTYGAVYRLGMDIVVPYMDPVPGFIAAAPYLGFKMRYFTTGDRNTFLRAVRFYISKGHPVVVELDAGKLWKEENIKPHVEVFMAYDSEGFEYFETGKENRFKVWARGLRVDDDGLVEAVTSMTEQFITPWKFSFIIFEKDGKKKEDIKAIWRKNGSSLVGDKLGGLMSGSQAIRQFALKYKKTGKVRDLKPIEAAVYTRLDNSRFLRKYFPGDKDIEKAARLFTDAANRYERALSMMKKKEKSKQDLKEISDILLNAASIEKEIGEIFIGKGGEEKK